MLNNRVTEDWDSGETGQNTNRRRPMIQTSEHNCGQPGYLTCLHLCPQTESLVIISRNNGGKGG